MAGCVESGAWKAGGDGVTHEPNVGRVGPGHVVVATEALCSVPTMRDGATNLCAASIGVLSRRSAIEPLPSNPFVLGGATHSIPDCQRDAGRVAQVRRVLRGRIGGATRLEVNAKACMSRRPTMGRMPTVIQLSGGATHELADAQGGHGRVRPPTLCIPMNIWRRDHDERCTHVRAVAPTKVSMVAIAGVSARHHPNNAAHWEVVPRPVATKSQALPVKSLSPLGGSHAR